MIKKINFKKLFIIILITFLIGNLFTFFVMNNMGDYKSFIKPALSPPGIVFPIVWSILFLLMSISFYMITETYDVNKKSAYSIYFIQLFVNAFWTLFFFGLDLKLFSFLWILLLIFLVIIMIIRFTNINKTAGYLQIPYLVWLIFAAYLNFGVYLLNK